MTTLFNRTTVFGLVLLLGIGGGLAGSLRAWLGSGGQVRPLPEEEEHRGKDHQVRPVAEMRRAAVRLRYQASIIARPPFQAAAATSFFTTACRNLPDTGHDLRNGIGAPLLC